MIGDAAIGAGVHVLIVDDQRAARAGLTLMVDRAEDLTVVGEADNGQEAIDLLEAWAAAGRRLPDVVLMDIRMPVLNGIDATAAITRRHPGVQVLIMTTYDEDDYAFGALDAGAAGFLLKDTRTADLQRAIRAVADGDAVLTPRITAEMIRRRRSRSVITSRGQTQARSALESLSPREIDVAALVAQGLNNAEIAGRLTLQPDSVKKTVSRILTRLQLRDRIQIVVLWNHAGW
ncbi:response regulator [Brachybacterium alimentarium]|uniref:response regulator n=1 Tax=Brachybacterium alimentarium TaxID=47845 RepID=UPI003FD0CF13